VRRGRGLRRFGALAAVAAVAIAGCGTSEKTFTASEFIDQVDEQGVALELGRQLPAGGGADEIYAITLPRLPGEPRPPSGEEGGGRGPNGTLYVYGDEGGAGDELDACRASAGLLCFRAANIVVVLDEDTGGIQAQRLGLAIRRLASG
jgi:hypothetical protein